MSSKIRSKLGTALESELYSYPKKDTLIKIKILHDINNHIKPRMYISNIKDESSWIDFRYEKLLMFCFNYGIIGHNEEFCTKENRKSMCPNKRKPF